MMECFAPDQTTQTFKVALSLRTDDGNVFFKKQYWLSNDLQDNRLFCGPPVILGAVSPHVAHFFKIQ